MSLQRVRLLNYITFVLFLTWCMFFSINAAIDIPTVHIDGAFQTASSLFRLDSGQLPGRDFFPYLGTGPVFLLFPLFKMFGGNMAASIISAHFVTLLVAALSVALIFHLVFRPKLFSTSLSISSFLYWAPIAIALRYSFNVYHWFGFSIFPGNSLRPIRASAPYLVILSYYFLVLRISNQKLRYVICGAICAAILLWSNDYAIPSAGLFSGLVIFTAIFKKESETKSFLIYLFSALLSWLVLVNIATQGHPLAILKYNFVDVAKDQWWYFGPYDHSSRIFSIWDIGRIFSEENYFPFIVTVLIGALALKTKCVEYALLLWIGLVLFAGGCIASIGGHLGGYFYAFYFFGCISFIAILTKFFISLLRKFNNQKLHDLLTLQNILLVSLICSSIFLFSFLKDFRANLVGKKNDPNIFYVPELGGYLGKEWNEYIDLIRNTESNKIIEEYWGLFSATKKIVSNWPTDSVISALGSKREIAKNRIEDADFIVSSRFNGSADWQTWSLGQNYWFYEQLIENWKPYKFSPKTVVWVKKKNYKRNKVSKLECLVGKELIMRVPDTGLYELRINYSIPKKGRLIFLVKNNLFYGADKTFGYISLDPRGDNAKFPVYLQSSGIHRIETKLLGNSDSNLGLLGCEASLLPAINKNVFQTRDLCNFPAFDLIFPSPENICYSESRPFWGRFGDI